MRQFNRFFATILAFTAASSSVAATIEVDAANELGTFFNYGRYHNMASSTSPEGAEDAALLKRLDCEIIRVRFKIPEWYDMEEGKPTYSNLYPYLDQASQLTEEIFAIFDGDDEVEAGEIEFSEWRSATRAAIEHYVEKYPNIRYIGALNEPDHRSTHSQLDTPAKYYRYYKEFYKMTREVDAALQLEVPLEVGGPNATRMGESNGYLAGFLTEFVNDPSEDKQLDFISYHRYNPELPSAVAHDKATIQDWLRERNMDPSIPIWVAETGLWFGARSSGTLVEDQLRQAAGTAAYGYYYMGGGVDLAYHWVNDHPTNARKDLFVDGRDGVPTPFYNAVEMQTMLKETRIFARSSEIDPSTGIGLNAFGTMDEEGVTVMVWNYQHTGTQGHDVTLKIANLPVALAGKDVRVEKRLIDEFHSNHNHPDASPHLTKVSSEVYPATDSIELTFDLSANAVCLLQFTSAEM